MTSRDSQTLSPTKREMAGWIGRAYPEVYACKLHQLRITIAEALFIMSETPDWHPVIGWRDQERVIREMIRLEKEGYTHD